MKKIPLTKGKYAIVDDEDYPYISRFKWQLSGDGYFAVRAFHNNGSKSASVYMHQLLIEARVGVVTTHINNDGLDNRKENLAYCSRSHWSQSKEWPKEKKALCSSKYKGVTFRKRQNKWSATISLHGKYIHIGSFLTEKEAAKAYNAKALELYGENAYQNKIV